MKVKMLENELVPQPIRHVWDFFWQLVIKVYLPLLTRFICFSWRI